MSSPSSDECPIAHGAITAVVKARRCSVRIQTTFSLIYDLHKLGSGEHVMTTNGPVNDPLDIPVADTTMCNWYIPVG